MKKRTVFLLTLLPLLLVCGCEGLFQFNLFDSLDQPDIPTAADLAAMGNDALAYLSEALQSDDFMDALSEDEAAAQAILTFLEDTFLSEVPDEESRGSYQEAAVLYAKIEFGTSEAGTVANNLVETIASSEDAVDLSAIFPSGMTDEEFNGAFDAMLSAARVYTLLGESLIDIDGDGTVDASGDINMGEVVQDAIVAIYVQTVVDNIPGSDEEKKAAFKDHVLNDGPDPVPAAIDIGESLNTNTALNNIFEAADFSMDF